MPLTRHRTKGAVPFGGMFRLIDFTLSNAVHSGLRQIHVLPQYKYASLKRHLKLGWNLFRSEFGESLTVVPPQEGIVDGWYRGTADAVHLNQSALFRSQPDIALILSSDHVYRMDYGEFVTFHRERGADLTIASIEVPLRQARPFGILQMGGDGRINAFAEKPDPGTLPPSASGQVCASMGLYVFETDCLRGTLAAITDRPGSTHDFGRDVIPWMIDHGHRVFGWAAGTAGSTDYWRDIGELDAFWAASMDLLGPHPAFDLWDPQWPILSHRPQLPPARITSANGMACDISDSLLSPGCTVNGARVVRSVLSPDVYIEPGAQVVDAVLLDGVHVGRGARIERAVIDKRVVVPDGYCVGGIAMTPTGATVSPGGVTAVSKEQTLPWALLPVPSRPIFTN